MSLNNPCCPDPFECGGEVTSSSCVVYAGNNATVTSLPINQGDGLTSVVSNLITAINNVSSGSALFLDGYQSCSSSNPLDSNLSIYPQPYSIVNFAKAVSQAFCSVQSQINTLTSNSILSAFSNLNLSCLQGVTNTSAPSAIIQSIINQLCQNTTTITGLSSQVASLQNQVNTLSNNKPTFTPADLMPPYVPMPYIGPLSNFDSTGKGLASAGYDKVYIMNGQNGTPDWRGYSPIGATALVPGGTLDSRVSSLSLAPGQKAGEVYHQLTTAEMPSHTHAVNDNGHTHNLTFINMIHSNITGSTLVPTLGNNPASPITLTNVVNTALTGITIGSTGGGVPHNTLHPVVGVVWIVKIP